LLRDLAMHFESLGQYGEYRREIKKAITVVCEKLRVLNFFKAFLMAVYSAFS